MESHPASRIASRIAAAVGVVIAVVGLFLLFGPRPSAGEGIWTAVQTIVGGALLVAAGLAGLGAVALWLLAERRTRRLR
jgi:protein-S-isoprenylcysteine O-methyltransferase Ste14